MGIRYGFFTYAVWRENQISKKGGFTHYKKACDVRMDKNGKKKDKIIF